jgi:transmembrane sensor
MSPLATPDLRAEAVEWLVRVMDSTLDTAAESTRAGVLTDFHAWLSKSPQHLEALREALETLRTNGKLDRERSDDLRQLLPNNVVAFPRRTGQPDEGRIVPSPDRPARYLPESRRPWAAPCSTIVLLMLVAAGAMICRWSPPSTLHATHVGERKEIRLPEGSTIYLNTNTEIRVGDIAGGIREIRLERGEALFDVKHAAGGGPALRVLVGDVAIRDIGTKFNVYRHDNGSTTVSVLDGLVQISAPRSQDHSSSPAAGTTAAPTRRPGATECISSCDLRPGSVVDLPTLGPVSYEIRHVPVSDLEHKLSWMEGKLWFGGESLTEAVAEFNRYNQRQVVITDPRIATLPIGGRFDATDVLSFIGALEVQAPIRILPPDPAHPGPDVIRLGWMSK